MKNFKAFYFLYFAANAALLPYLVLFYKSLGLDGSQIGLLAGIPPMLTLIGAPFWGGIADVTKKYKYILLLSISVIMVSVLLFSFTQTFSWLLPLVVIYSFFVAPIIPLIDNSVLIRLGEKRNNYGSVRLWGAIGWGLMSPIAGWLIEKNNLNWSFYCYLALMFAGFLVSWIFITIKPGELGGNFWHGLRELLRDKRWGKFLVLIFIAGIGSGVIQTYLFLLLEDLGASKTLMGFSMTTTTLSEIVVLSASGWLICRWGEQRILLISMLFFALRSLAVSYLIKPWIIIPIQLLHGMTYPIVWATGVAYVNRISPERLGATAQGLFSAVFVGLGIASGAFFGGLIYESLGAASLFRWNAILNILVFIVLIFAWRGKKSLVNN